MLYHEKDPGEVKQQLRSICNVSQSEEEVLRRIREELGCPYGATITSTSCGSSIMFMVMIHGPDGKTISV